MPTETLSSAEATHTAEYNHRSFDLVFSSFCKQYAQKLKPVIAEKNGKGFLGLPKDASVPQMGQRLNEVMKAIGEPPQVSEEYLNGPSIQEAILLSARYLAWNAVMGGLTNQYVDKLRVIIDEEHRSQHSKHLNHNHLHRLTRERKAAVSTLIAQNHALRNYFDSNLAHTLGNDSPRSMDKLLSKVPFLDSEHRQATVKGISLEIAAKKYLQAMTKMHNGSEVKVAYGDSRQDAMGGDLVLISDKDILFIDLKSSMPKRFSDLSYSTPADYSNGYKWLEDEDNARKVVTWAYEYEPIKPDKFMLNDARLAGSLELIAGTSSV